MTRIFAAALCLFAAAPGALMAQAACPTAADLDRGIRVTFEDGGTETYRNSSLAVVAVTGRDPDGLGFEMDLARGIHLLYWEGTNNGQLEGAPNLYDYGLAPADLPLPVAGKGWSSDVTVTGPDGARAEPQTHRYGPLSSIAIGDCQYDMMELTISYATPDNYVEMLRWLPELGIAYLVWNEADGMDRFVAEATQIMRAGK
jgi:hypothetical protein